MNDTNRARIYVVMARSTRTYAIVEALLPKCMADTVFGYLIANSSMAAFDLSDDFDIARSGLGELYPRINDRDVGLAGACATGNIDLIHAMIARGAHNWNIGLKNACANGQVEAAHLMKKHGATLCRNCVPAKSGSWSLGGWAPVDPGGGTCRLVGKLTKQSRRYMPEQAEIMENNWSRGLAADKDAIDQPWMI